MAACSNSSFFVHSCYAAAATVAAGNVIEIVAQ